MKSIPNLVRSSSLACVALACLLPPAARAGVFAVGPNPQPNLAPGGTAGEGPALSVSGDNALVGGYFLSSLSAATGTISSGLSLISSDFKTDDGLGLVTSLSGSMALVGAPSDTVGLNNQQGSAYLFRNVTTSTGTVTQQAKLLLSNGAAMDRFANDVSLSGSRALVTTATNASSNFVYLYTGLDTATGTVFELARLAHRKEDLGLVPFGGFDIQVGLEGSIGVVASDQGTYLYRNLDTIDEGTIGQDATLAISGGGSPSPGAAVGVSVSGTSALVSSGPSNVYLYRNLDTATDTVTEQARLSMPAGGRLMNNSISLSGSVALVGMAEHNAYLYLGLDTATGTVTPDVELHASADLNAEFGFGSTVSLSGDNFLVGLYLRRAVSGSVSSLTTLDVGNASRTIDGLTFVSHGDWIIGKTTDGNAVTLSSNDAATVTDAGKAVFIGQNAGSDHNTLTIDGTLTATDIRIGATGNTDNQLVVKGALNAAAVTIADSSSLVLDLPNAGDTLAIGSLSGTGRVQLGAGNLAVGSANADTGFLGVIEGTGGLVKEGIGTFVLGGANTYTGGAIVKTGGLVVANDGDNTFGRLGGGTTTVKSGAGFTGRGTLTFTGNASAEAANIVLEGGTAAGTLGGTLQFNNTTSAGSATIVANGGTNGGAGGSILLQDSSSGGSAQFDVRGNALLSLSFHAAGAVPIGSLAGDGTVTLGSKTLATGGNGLSTTFSGIIQGGGALIKEGTGTFALGGANTYTGATTVNAGTLLVNGSLASTATTVKSGATLGGAGSLHALTVENGALLAPGNSLGTLTASSLTWDGGATLVFDLGAGGASDLLNLSGNVGKGEAGAFRFTFQNADWVESQTYTLVTFDGTTDFAASDFSFTNGGGFDGDFAINGNALQFTLTAVPEPSTCLLVGMSLVGLATFRRLRSR